MNHILKFVFIILILGFLLICFKLNNKLLKYEQKIITLQHENQKLKYNLDSLKVAFAKQSSEHIDKREIKNLINTFISKRENKFFPDLFPIKGDYVISQKYSLKHPAIDLASPLGTEVVASASGVVSDTLYDKFFGKTVILDHLNGYQTKYSHLAKILVQKKCFIDKGDLIGLVGSTGRSSAPHLHFEVIKDKNNIDPEKILKRGN